MFVFLCIDIPQCNQLKWLTAIYPLAAWLLNSVPVHLCVMFVCLELFVNPLFLSGRKARGFQELKHFKGQYSEINGQYWTIKAILQSFIWGAATYMWYSLQRKPVHLTDCQQDFYQSKSCYLENPPLSVAYMHANSDGRMVLSWSCQLDRAITQF